MTNATIDAAKLKKAAEFTLCRYEKNMLCVHCKTLWRFLKSPKVRRLIDRADPA